MIKRPLNPQFSSAVLDGRKFTTIREKPWPVGVTIMLYNWSGAAYRSKQIDVAPVIVEETCEIKIFHDHLGITYAKRMQPGCPLYQSEGFESRDAMDEWFLPLVKPWTSVTKHLMLFRLLND